MFKSISFRRKLVSKHVEEITAQFFREVPKVLENKGYYDWVSSNLKR